MAQLIESTCTLRGSFEHRTGHTGLSAFCDTCKILGNRFECHGPSEMTIRTDVLCRLYVCCFCYSRDGDVTYSGEGVQMMTQILGIPYP